MLSGGLVFSSGIDYNYNTSGNPGLFLKGYYNVNKRFLITPSLTVFNRNVKEEFYFKLTNYMFHFDIDAQYGLIKEDQIVFFAFTGINTTTIISRYKVLENVGQDQIDNASTIKPGINLGGGIKMYINKTADALLSAKYTAGGFSQFIISLGVIYHLDGNNRKGW